jgi:hypothetical protein
MTLELLNVATMPDKTLQPPIRAQRSLQFDTVCSRGLRLNVEPLGSLTREGGLMTGSDWLTFGSRGFVLVGALAFVALTTSSGEARQAQVLACDSAHTKADGNVGRKVDWHGRYRASEVSRDKAGKVVTRHIYECTSPNGDRFPKSAFFVFDIEDSQTDANLKDFADLQSITGTVSRYEDVRVQNSFITMPVLAMVRRAPALKK